MNVQRSCCTDEYQGRLNIMAGQHSTAWRNALAGLVSPIVRLHELRNIRTRMLHEALADLDRCESRDADA